MDAERVLASMHRRLHAALGDVLSDLDDRQIQAQAESIDVRPIWEIAVHVQRPVLAAVCELAAVDRPPRPAQPGSTSALLAILDDMATQIDRCLTDVPGSRWSETISLPWGRQPALDAYLDCIAHGLVHVGNIAGVRAINGFPTPPEGD